MANFNNGPTPRGVARILGLVLTMGTVITVATAADARPETNTHAGNNDATQQITLHKACTAQGGWFERAWTYNDQGVQWGNILSCSTGTGYITCQADVCRAGRWMRPNSESSVSARPETSNGAVDFPADPVAFSAALSAISGQ